MKFGLLRSTFLSLTESCFTSFSHIEVLEKDNTFPRVTVLAHKELGGIWLSTVTLKEDLAADCENTSLSQS